MAVSGRRFDTPLAPAAVTAALCLVFVLGRLAVFEGDVTRFVQAGDRLVQEGAAPAGLSVEHGTGFDGQFFYRLALDPLTSKRYAHGMWLDLPALRQQRILYPALAWAASGGGRPPAVPWALLALNLGGVFAVGALGGAFARSTGRHALWGLILSLYPGFAVTLGLDLAEILASAFVLGGLLLMRRGRPGIAGVSLAAAVLTRETALIAVLGIAAVWGWNVLRRRPPGVSVTAFAPAIAAYAAVQTWLWARWGEAPLASGGSVNIGLPFRKIVAEVAAWPEQGTAFAVYHWLLLAALVVFAGAVLASLRTSHALPHEKAGFVLAAVLVPFLAGTIWLHYWASLRALTELFLLGAVVFLSRPAARIDRLAAVTVTLWISVALNMTVAAARFSPPIG